MSERTNVTFTVNDSPRTFTVSLLPVKLPVTSPGGFGFFGPVS